MPMESHGAIHNNGVFIADMPGCVREAPEIAKVWQQARYLLTDLMVRFDDPEQGFKRPYIAGPPLLLGCDTIIAFIWMEIKLKQAQIGTECEETFNLAASDAHLGVEDALRAFISLRFQLYAMPQVQAELQKAEPHDGHVQSFNATMTILRNQMRANNITDEDSSLWRAHGRIGNPFGIFADLCAGFCLEWLERVWRQTGVKPEESIAEVRSIQDWVYTQEKAFRP